MVDIMKWLFGTSEDPKAGSGIQHQDPDAAPAVPGFPVELLAHHKTIEATRLPILAATQLDGVPETDTTSRLGGWPWWPLDRPYPTDTAGKPLMHLIQVNFDEAPVLADFPQTGLLQIFIGTDDLYGCNVDAPGQPTGFACVYHPTPTQPARTDFSDITFALSRQPPHDYTPLEDPMTPIPLSFSHSTMLVDPSDYRFATLIPELSIGDKEQYEAMLHDVPAIRLGGYPTFTQQDPRKYLGDLGDVTLLTIDTARGVMWGDCGVAQFLMSRDRLIARDFSAVAYNWDCG